MVTVVTPTKITCGVDLTGAITGLWSLTVTNPDGQGDTLAGAFIIYNPAPTVASITPNTGKNDGMTDVLTIRGTGFLNGTAVKLIKSGQPDIIAKGPRSLRTKPPLPVILIFQVQRSVLGMSW